MKDKIKFNVADEEVNTLPPVEEVPEEEVSDEIDNLETIEDDNEEQFYASSKYNELRDAMQDTDFRLFLIGNDLVIPGTLDGNEIQFLDIVGDDENEEFVMKPAPTTLKELLDFKTLFEFNSISFENSLWIIFNLNDNMSDDSFSLELPNK